MEKVLEEIEFKIDKTSWKLVKFGDIVVEPKETCKDILSEGITHVVGLEHIDSEDIHLKKSASIEESTTFTKKFKEGDVLFGRRRAYLKKAALSSFSGICSGDITVFRAKDNLLPELLPFIVHNEKFFDYAVKHSAGGLSPRVKFKDLAEYEFLLPPKEQQEKLAELLWAMDEVLEKEKEVNYISESLKKSYLNHLKNSTIGICEVKDLFELKWGNTNITKKSYVNDGFIAFSAAGPDGYLPHFEFDTTGIVLSAIGADCGKCFKANGKWTAIKNTITLIPIEKNEDLVDVVFEIINDKRYWNSSGGAQPFISQTDARISKLPKLDAENIKLFSKIFNKINNSILVSKLKIENSHSLQKSLINQVF